MTVKSQPRWKFVAISALILGLLAVVAGVLIYPRLKGPRPPDPHRFDTKIASFGEIDRATPPPANPILFVGSSSIRLWPTDSLFSEFPVLNRGFGGSHISDVNHFVQDVVVPYAPQVIVFYAGDNDVNDGKSPAKVLSDYRNFVSHVRDAGQSPFILFVSIKPSPSRWSVWPQMAEANDLIRTYSESDSLLEYVDLASLMLVPDGRPRGNLFVSDSLHLSDEGYREWTDALRPVLESLYSE